MVIHDFLSTSLLDTTIVPLHKDKQGDVADHDNHRPLAITCVASKIFKCVIFHCYMHLLTTTANQFVFLKRNCLLICVCVYCQ